MDIQSEGIPEVEIIEEKPGKKKVKEGEKPQVKEEKKVIVLEQPRFELPSNYGTTARELKRQLNEYDEAKFVDDTKIAMRWIKRQ